MGTGNAPAVGRPRPARRSTSLTSFLMLVSLLGACSSLERLDAVPDGRTSQAEVLGSEVIRYHVGIDTEALRTDAVASVWREVDFLEASGHTGPLPPANFLVISGGGDKGAFTAGLLNGWTETGDRPEFKLVTGVSTGALIAPFAFLGSTYDDRLERLYTDVAPEDIMKRRSLLAALSSDALADTAPLWRLIEKEVDQALLDAVAAEHEKGRILLIATVDLDARQSVLWNMTKIAASPDPRALTLFRSIMIGSASIPGAFPPVMIDVELDGRPYQEMHVDGGTMAQLFVYPPGLHPTDEEQRADIGARQRTLYVIRNARLDPDWASVERQTLSITGRAISSLIHTQGIGDLYRVYLIANRDGADFNLAFVPADFTVPHREEFDTEFMRALYQRGYEMAVDGYPWEKTPPGF